MVPPDDKLRHVRDLADQAVSYLSDSSAGLVGEVRERLDSVLIFAQLVVGRSDGALVPQAAVNEVEAILTEFIDAPEIIASQQDDWMDRLLAALDAFPVAQGREFEQDAKGAAKTFSASVRQRFAAVERKADELRLEVESLGENLGIQRAEIGALVDEVRAQQDAETERRLEQMDARIGELQAAAERHAQTIETLSTEQAEVFRQAQEKRADEARAHAETHEAEITEERRRLTEEGQAVLDAITKMKVESAELVGAIGITGTAERYSEEFNEQRKVADRWRLITIGVGVIAAAVAVWAAYDHDESKAGAKIALAILIGGVSVYTARQSARHRHREEHARQLQLDLTAFPVFIENLPESERNEATSEMVLRSFRGALPEPTVDDESGLGTFGQLRPRRKPKTAGDGDEG